MTMHRVLPLLAALLAVNWAWEAGARAPEPAAPATTKLAKWKAGTNYQLLGSPQPTIVSSGNIEVSEVFWYGCGHCYALEPEIDNWKKTKPGYIEFVRVPVIWSPAHRQHAKLYYTLLALGRPDLHRKVFDAIHQEGNSLAARNETDARALQFEFFSREGISEKEFNAAYDSMTVAANVLRADKLTQELSVATVPMIYVNGKFSTSVSEAGGTAALFALINDLAASEKNR